MPGRSTAQPDRKNCFEDRCSGDFVRASANGTGPEALPRYWAPGNPRTALFRRLASQWHQRVASVARSGPGTSISSDVGSEVAISTYSHRPKAPHSPRNAKL